MFLRCLALMLLKPYAIFVPVSSKKLSPVHGLVSSVKQNMQDSPKNYVKVCPLFHTVNSSPDLDGVTTWSSNSFAPLALKPAFLGNKNSIVKGEFSSNGDEKFFIEDGEFAVGDGDVEISAEMDVALAPHDGVADDVVVVAPLIRAK